MNNTEIFNFTGGSLAYIDKGGLPGAPVVLAFHGFGQSGTEALPFLQTFFPGHRILAFDLFFHGQSTRADKKIPVSLQDLKEVFTAFFREKNISRFDLYGFSMGGRFALALTYLFPEAISNLTLAAPDGIAPSIWYTLATGKGIMREWFKAFALRPGLFIKLANRAHRCRLVKKRVAKFAMSQMQNRAQRMRVYYSWTNFRHLKIHKSELRNLLNTRPIATHVYLGRYDTVIPGAEVAKFFKNIKNVRVTFLDCGHGSLQKMMCSLPRQSEL